MPTTIDKTNPEWASQLAQQVEEAKADGTNKVSEAFAHLAPLIEAVGTTEAQVGNRFKLHGLVASGIVYVTLSEAGVGTDIELFRSGEHRLAGAVSPAVIPRERAEVLRANLGVLVQALEDALVDKANRLIDEASW